MKKSTPSDKSPVIQNHSPRFDPNTLILQIFLRFIRAAKLRKRSAASWSMETVKGIARPKNSTTKRAPLRGEVHTATCRCAGKQQGNFHRKVRNRIIIFFCYHLHISLEKHGFWGSLIISINR